LIGSEAKMATAAPTSVGASLLLSFSLRLGLALAATSSAAAEQPAVWVEVESPHFVVVSDAGEKGARRAAEQFERFRFLFLTAVPSARMDPGQPIIILAVKSEQSLRALLPAYWEVEGRVHPAGVFMPGPEKHYAALRLDALGDNPYEVLYHEYSHLLIALNLPNIPLWLNEGLAEFFAHTTVTGRETGLGGLSRSHVRRLLTESPLPLEVLLKVDHESPYYNEANKTSIFYAQAWALTHFLMVGDNAAHRGQLSAFLAQVDHGADTIEAATLAFGDLRRLERTLAGYVRDSRFFYLPVNTQQDLDRKAFAARTLSVSSAAAIRGDFHVRTGRLKEARTLLEEAMQLDPELAAPRESMGMLCQREGKPDEAFKWFAEAVALDSNSFLAHYYSAVFAGRDSTTPGRIAAAEAGYRKAIEIRPGFAPAYTGLAQLLASRGERLDEALALARRAVELEPGKAVYYLTVANLLLRLRRVEEAEALASKVLATVKDPADREAARQMVEYVHSQKAGPAKREPPVELPSAPPKPAAKPGSAPTQAGEGPLKERGGRVVTVECEDARLVLTVDGSGGPVKLVAGNYFQIEFLTQTWTPPDDFNPCLHLKGREVRVRYRPATDQVYAGNVVSIEISK